MIDHDKNQMDIESLENPPSQLKSQLFKLARAHGKSFAAGFIGGLLGLLLFSSGSEHSHTPQDPLQASFDAYHTTDDTQEEPHPDDFYLLQQRVAQLEQQLAELGNTIANNSDSADTEQANAPGKARQPRVIKGTRLSQAVTPNKGNLLAAGVNEDIAEDVLRRISQQEFRRLELQNLIRRNPGENSDQYRDELRELNNNRITLRGEIGDESYDQYLFSSGQNNRVQVNSVMSDSPAESAGFQAGDVILSYDQRKILNWSDIREATSQGEIGNYTSVDVLRDGVRMSLMVPRGTLGVQLDAVQLDPAQ